MKKTEQEQEQPQEQAVAKSLTPIQRFQQNIEQYEQSVLPNLLKKHNIDVSQFKQIVLSEIKKNAKLLEAFMSNPASMFASILAGAEIGLIPSDMLGEFYLIPRKIDGKPSVTPLIGYKGLVNILLRSGEITRIHTEVVYEGEEFEPTYGLEPNIIHKPNFSLPRTSDKIKFAYAVAKMKNGEYQFCVLSRLDIMNIQSLSKYNNDLYFNDKKDPNKWMLRKIALVQLSKMLPKDFHGKKAVELDSRLEGGATIAWDEEQKQVIVIDGKKITPVKQASVSNTLGSLPDIPE